MNINGHQRKSMETNGTHAKTNENQSQTKPIPTHRKPSASQPRHPQATGPSITCRGMKVGGSGVAVKSGGACLVLLTKPCVRLADLCQGSMLKIQDQRRSLRDSPLPPTPNRPAYLTPQNHHFY